jgi:ATP synthase protein I
LGRFLSEDTRDFLRLIARVSSMGLAMAIAIVLGFGAGLMVDNHFGTAPWGFLIGLVVGVVAGFRNLWIIGKRLKIF